MDLNRVAVFVKVIEVGSFTAAAGQLGLPKSSISRAVSRLEQELGVRLLQRTTRQLHLTEAGRAYFDRARAALHGLEEAASSATNLSVEPRGTVRVTAPINVGRLKLAEIVARFRRKYPLVNIELSFSSRFVDLVGEGFDLALRAGRLRDSTLVARKIGADSLGVFASPGYLKRRGKPKTLRDLAGHECVLFRGVQGKTEWRLTGPRGEESVTVHGAINADELAFVEDAVLAGLGVALLPSISVRLAVAESKLGVSVRLLPEYSSPGADLHLVMPSQKFRPASVVAFADFLYAELTRLWRSA